MPIIKSAKKRVKTARKATVRNAKTKRNLRESLKAFSATLASGNQAKITEAQKNVQSALDIAVKKDVIHKNKASRKKAQLSAKAKSAGAKPSAKSAVKKPAAKKTVTKKPAAKKSAPKK